MVFNALNIFNLDLSDIIILFCGFGLGFFIALMLYVFLVMLTINPKKYIIKSKATGLTNDEIDEKIKIAQEMFLDKTLQGELTNLMHCKEICYNLVFDIASVYFPNSKRPLMELSVDEVLMLGVYISNRVNEILDQKGVRLFKKIKLSTIVGMGDAKKTFDDSSLMKATKKYKLKEAFYAVKDALNVVNPIFWARKAIVNKTMNYALNKLCLMVIGITAEETYKIYSKNVFNVDVERENKYTNIGLDIEKDLADISEEELDDYEVEE